MYENLSIKAAQQKNRTNNNRNVGNEAKWQSTVKLKINHKRNWWAWNNGKKVDYDYSKQN